MQNRPPAPPAPSQHRYRVHLIEQLRYRVDVLARSEDEAREIAAQTEQKGEADTLSFDLDVIDALTPNDVDFLPVNGCRTCGARIEDRYDEVFRCPACRPPRPAVRAAGQRLCDAVRRHLAGVESCDLPAEIEEAMAAFEAACRSADAAPPAA